MSGGETHLIQKYLAPLAAPEGLGLRDDAAYYAPPAGHDLVITTDTLVEGTHFLPQDRAFDIGVKAITVNLSDLIAKGADPVGYTLALTFPEPPAEAWVAAFAEGIGEFVHGKLFGGDMTVGGGALVISVTAIGKVPTGQMVRRDGARAGDLLFLSGPIGTSGAGLRCLQDIPWAKRAGLTAAETHELVRAYCAPMIAFDNLIPGHIRAHASAAMDVSDGLLLDLQRLCTASDVGARVDADAVPMNPVVQKLVSAKAMTRQQAFTAGDDYVALIAAPPSAHEAFQNAGLLRFHCIGAVVGPEEGVVFFDTDGTPLDFDGKSGFDHFRS